MSEKKAVNAPKVPKFDPAKLEKLQKASSAARVGGKGSVRRKVAAKSHPKDNEEDFKIMNAMKRIGCNSIPCDEVVMHKADGKVIKFVQPRLLANPDAKLFYVHGHNETKELTAEEKAKELQEMLPQLLSSLPKDKLDDLAKNLASAEKKEEVPPPLVDAKEEKKE